LDSILLPVVIVSVIGLLAGIMLAVASKFMAVKVDETFEKIRAELPGANCGACGYAGCDEYANHVADKTAKTNLCIPGGDSVSKKLSEILGVAFEDVIEQYAIVRCSGVCGATEYIMDYQGPKNCEACNTFYEGRGSCSYSCLGFGDCVAVCKYDAIHIIDGIAYVDKQKCTGCGMCAKACPKAIINIIPATSNVYVACSSKDKGAFTRKICKNGCIGCKKCEKVCEAGAIVVNDNLAAVDPNKCTNCGKCIEGCPTGVIRNYFCAEYVPQKA